MKSPSERSSFGNWLLAQRTRLSEERGRKIRQVDMAEEIRAAGYPIRDDYYRAIESGAKTPGRETRVALGRFFGSQPPMTDEPKAELSDLVDAIRQQTATMERLIERLDRNPEQEAEALAAALASHLGPLLAGQRADQRSGAT